MVKALGANDKIISGLAAASALAGADLVPVVQGGATKKATVDQISTFVSRAVFNASLTTPGAGWAADAVLAGSGIAIPDGSLKARTLYRCFFSVAKTNAGTVAPVLTIRFGTAGTVADASRSVRSPSRCRRRSWTKVSSRSTLRFARSGQVRLR